MTTRCLAFIAALFAAPTEPLPPLPPDPMASMYTIEAPRGFRHICQSLLLPL